jgi:hypothetical protein
LGLYGVTMPALWGNLLSGIAQGYQANNQLLEDQSFQRQQRANQLATEQLANQGKTLEIQQTQNAINQDQAQTGFLTSAAQDTYGGGQQTGAQGLAGAANPQPISGAIAQPNPNGASQPVDTVGVPQMTAATGGLPATQNGQVGGKPLDPLQRSVMTSESNGQAAATSPKGAQGTMQTMPGTLQNPGFGVQPARDGSDAEKQRVGVDYLSAMLQRYGNPSDALAAYNWGPQNADKWIQDGRKPDKLPPATANYIKTTLGRLQQGQQQSQQEQQQVAALKQPSAADQVQAHENAGAGLPVPAYQQAVQAQAKQVAMFRDAAQKAQQAGNVKAAMTFNAQADKLVDQGLDLQKKAFDVQKEANTETAKLAVGVQDQSSYNNFRRQVQNNPAMQQAVAGLQLTGDYAQDRNKIQTLADRTETLKDQQEMKIKQGELQLKQQAEQRAQQKADVPKIQQQQAVIADQTRQQTMEKGGVPFSPSIAASAPVGTTPVQLEAARKQVQTQNAAYDKANATAVQGAKSLSDLAAQAYVAVTNKTVSTGGIFSAVAERAAKAGAPFLLSSEQQEFDKLTNNMVVQMQQLAGANGGARSASTAAMYNNYARAKPNVGLSPEANQLLAHGLYVGAMGQVQMNQFLDKYRQANPEATAQSGVLQWRRYEQAAGPTMVFDPASKTMVPNTVLLPTLEDGSTNPAYKNPDTFFQNGGHF